MRKARVMALCAVAAIAVSGCLPLGPATTPPAVTPPSTLGAPSAGWPDATTTGVPVGTSLTPRSSIDCDWVISTPGTVINGVDLTGCIDVEASNVTIQNTRITSNTWWGIKFGASNSNATGLRVLNDTIGAVAGQGPDNGFSDYAIQAVNTTGTMEIAYNNIFGYMQGPNVVTGNVHDNYIHGIANVGHTEDIYVYSGGNGVVINHNTLIDDSQLQYSTTALYIAPDSGHQNNIVVTNNELSGGAYALYGGDDTATNIVVRDNSFSTAVYPDSGYYGPDAYWWPSNSGNAWSGNIWADGPRAGTAINP